MISCFLSTVHTLHYIASFFPHDRGATHAAVRLAKGLQDSGVSVEFIVEDQGPDWREGGMHDSFPVRSFPLTNPGKMRKLRGFFRLILFLKRRRKEIDLIHVHGAPYMNLLLAWLAGKIMGCPSIIKITSDGWDTPDGVRHARHGAIALWLYRRMDGVVAMTSGQARKCHDWNIYGKVQVIPNGVDLEQFRPAAYTEKITLRHQLHLPADRRYLVYAGWLGYGKGTDVLLKIWQGVKSEFPDVDLLLVGHYMDGETLTGPLADFLRKHDLPEAWARDPGLHMTGKVKDVSPYLRASDIFVFPSRREGFGTVQIEAMACGLPCLVNNLPGVSEDIFPDEKTGFRITDNNVDDFVAILKRLLTDQSLHHQVGQAARRRAEEHFSITKTAQRYLDFYNLLLNHPG